MKPSTSNAVEQKKPTTTHLQGWQAVLRAAGGDGSLRAPRTTFTQQRRAFEAGFVPKGSLSGW